MEKEIKNINGYVVAIEDNGYCKVVDSTRRTVLRTHVTSSVACIDIYKMLVCKGVAPICIFEFSRDTDTINSLREEAFKELHIDYHYNQYGKMVVDINDNQIFVEVDTSKTINGKYETYVVL